MCETVSQIMPVWKLTFKLTLFGWRLEGLSITFADITGMWDNLQIHDRVKLERTKTWRLWLNSTTSKNSWQAAKYRVPSVKPHRLLISLFSFIHHPLIFGYSPV